MRCTSCGKESNNQRVCPHCFMPYDTAGEPRTLDRNTQAVPPVMPRATQAAPRQTTAQPAPRATARDLPPIPPRGTVRDLPPVGFDAAIDRALSGLPMAGEEEAPAPPGALVRAWRWYRQQTSIVRWSLPLILLLAGIGLLPLGDDTRMGPGVTVPRATPDARAAAESLLAETERRATLEQSGEELVVTYAVTGFPGDEAGQRALAEGFARADALVSGRRRTIYFYTPQGRVFAKSDSVVGVMWRK